MVSEIIKQARERRGMTLEQVGNAVGVTKSTVRKWENGIIKSIRSDKIASLAKVLDLDPALLIAIRNYTDPDEGRIIELYHSMDERGKRFLLMQAEHLATIHGKE